MASRLTNTPLMQEIRKLVPVQWKMSIQQNAKHRLSPYDSPEEANQEITAVIHYCLHSLKAANSQWIM
jgi:hypothetical protein